MKSRFLILLITLVAIFSLFGWTAPFAVTTARAEDAPPLPVTHQFFNFYHGVLDTSPDGSPGENVYKNPPSPICSVSTTFGSNVQTDCEAVAPHNETSIAVNPTNPLNMIGGANDYQLNLSSGGTVNESAFTRAHVTFDGGKTWTMYPIRYNGYTATGDPAVSFDASGTAYMATLGFEFLNGRPGATSPDVLVASSSDGGKTWSSPVRVAAGTGNFASPGILNDKEYLTAWGNGNAIVTWTVFNLGKGGSYISSPIFASVTHDGGKTFSPGVEISGSAPFCIGATGGTTCNQDQGSTPVVAADGSVYVSFLATEAVNDFHDEYLVVKVDPQTGARVAGPFRVASLVDGIFDYPVSIDGRQTYQDSQFRTWSLGNIAADPTNASHLAVVWSDMRNTIHPVPTDPYAAKTNSDVVVSQSVDGGVTWSAPVTIAAPGDQFMPWSVYDGSGRLRIGYFDRSYDPANHKYGYTLATETAYASLSFSFSQVTTALSDPTQGTRWFSGRTPNSAFPHPTTFLGDYSGINQNGGGVVTLWTDMRVDACFGGRCATGENAFFAPAP